MNKNRLFIMIAVILFVVLAVLVVLAVKLNVENQPLPQDEQETEAAVETEDPTEEIPAQENSAEPTGSCTGPLRRSSELPKQGRGT